MKSRQVHGIIAVIVVVVVCLAGILLAMPFGTAFTYRGQLMDDGYPANGAYDFQFGLYDAPTDGEQQGVIFDVDDVNVVDGYFAVKLDFGDDPNTFNGDARWLQITVRPGESERPDGFVTLTPRQELTPTPYSLLAADVNTPLLLTHSSPGPVIRGTNPGEGAGVVGFNSTSGNYGATGGPDYGVKSNGDLIVDGNMVVDGADAIFRGTIGPNNGAPFPRPAYDSGWVSGTIGLVTLFHNIGGNVDNYVVDNQVISPDRGISGPPGNLGHPYIHLTTNSITVYAHSTSTPVRVRIWVYN